MPGGYPNGWPDVDPQLFAAVAKEICDELGARIAIGDPLETPEDFEGMAELITDSLMSRFEIRDPKSHGATES